MLINQILGFYINLPMGALVALAIVFIQIPEQTQKARALSILPNLHRLLDFVGFFLFAPAVLQLLLALQFGGNQFAWRSSQVIGLFCGSAATFIVWMIWNRHKGEEALLPHSLISRRTIWVAGLFQALFMSALYGSVYYLPIYFQAINGASAMLSGVYLLPTILPELVMAGIAGGLGKCTSIITCIADCITYDILSNEDWIHHSLCIGFYHSSINSKRALFNVTARQSHGMVDRVSANWRFWCWARSKPGQLTLFLCPSLRKNVKSKCNIIGALC